MPEKTKLKLPQGTEAPDHIVIIPDGNRRWARARGLSPMQGHRAGAKALAKTLESARNLGIHTVTFWGLSTENWRKRPEKESKTLMKTIGQGIEKHLADAKKEGVRVVHLGRKDRLPGWLVKKIEKAEKETATNTKHVFNIALDYGGQDEILRALRKIVKKKVKPEEIDEELMNSCMDTANQPYPYPDLIIRTSGEQRTSGILLWQSHYAEIYWEKDHFPDFSPEKLKEAILDYSRRRRRYGGNDAINHLDFKPEVTAKLELAWWRLRKIPQGTRLRDFTIEYLKEQYGLSKTLAKEAAKYMLKAAIEVDKKEWKKAKAPLKKFYKLVKNHLKLAFEPEIVTSLRIKLWQGMEGKRDLRRAVEVEETARNLFAEEYRISNLQASKAAHLRVLAKIERNLAEAGHGEHHWDRAEDYLQKFYKALKERVA